MINCQQNNDNENDNNKRIFIVLIIYNEIIYQILIMMVERVKESYALLSSGIQPGHILGCGCESHEKHVSSTYPNQAIIW